MGESRSMAGPRVLYQRHCRPNGGPYSYIDDGFIAGYRGIGCEVREWFDGAGEPTLAEVLDSFGPTHLMVNLQSTGRRESRWLGDGSVERLGAARERAGVRVAARSDPSDLRAYASRFGIDFAAYPEQGVESYYTQPDRPTAAEAAVLRSGVVDVLRTPHAREAIPELFAGYLALGVPVVEECFAADAGRYAPVAVEPTADVMFIGNAWRFKLANMEPYVRALRARFGSRMRVYGKGWPEGLSDGVLEAEDGGEDPFCRVACSARVQISLHEPTQVVGGPFAPNERPYKLLALGAAVVSDPNPMLMGQFREGEEILFARDPDEMVRLVEGLLADPSRAAAMGRRGRERVLSEHTYARRATAMLGLLAGGPQAAGACCAASTPAG